MSVKVYDQFIFAGKVIDNVAQHEVIKGGCSQRCWH